IPYRDAPRHPCFTPEKLTLLPIMPIILTIRARRAYASRTRFSAHSKERPMGSKRSARREFLKGSAALVGGLLGAAAPAIGQAPASPSMIKGDKDLIAYGIRSRFVTSVRIAHGGRPSPDDFGLVFHVAAP